MMSSFNCFLLLLATSSFNAFTGAIPFLGNLGMDISRSFANMNQQLQSNMMAMQNQLTKVFRDPNFPGNPGWNEKLARATQIVPANCKLQEVLPATVQQQPPRTLNQQTYYETYTCQDPGKPPYTLLVTTIVITDERGHTSTVKHASASGQNVNSFSHVFQSSG